VPADAQRVHVFAGLDSQSFAIPGTLLRGDCVHSTLAPKLLDSHTRLLTFLSHGRDEVIHLKDTVVCTSGHGRSAGDAGPGDRAPVCAYAGHCFRADVDLSAYLPAHRVRADIVLANSCHGMRTSGGLFPERFLLSYVFLAGFPFAYIAAPALVSGVEKVNLIMDAAMAGDATLGEAVSLINGHLDAEGSGLPFFTLLGAPWLTAPRTRPDAAGHAPPTATVIDITGGAAGSPAAAARTYVQGRADEFDGRPVIFAGGPRLATALRVLGGDPVTVPADDQFDETLREAGRAVECLGDLALLGLRYSRQNNIQVNLRGQISSACRAVKESLERGGTRSAGARLAKLTKALGRAESEVAAELWQRGTTTWFKFEDMWGDELRQRTTTSTAGDCPHCRGPMWTVHGEHPVMERIGRVAAMCGRCMIVSDLDPRSPIESMELGAPDLLYRGRTAQVDVRITCRPFATPGLTAKVGFYSDNCSFMRLSFPEPADLELRPGGTVTTRVLARVGEDAQMHQEFLRVFAVAAGTANYASRPMWIRP
jgi:hypothetical protein